MEIKIETPPQCPGRHEYQLWHRSSWMDTYKEGPSAKGPFQSPSLKPPLKPFVKAPCCLFCFTCLHNAFMHVDMYTCFIMFPAPLRWLKTTAIPRRKRVQLFFVRARCLSAGLRSWVLLTDQRGIEPPPAVCQRHKSDAIPTEPWGRDCVEKECSSHFRDYRCLIVSRAPSRRGVLPQSGSGACVFAKSRSVCRTVVLCICSVYRTCGGNL